MASNKCKLGCGQWAGPTHRCPPKLSSRVTTGALDDLRGVADELVLVPDTTLWTAEDLAADYNTKESQLVDREYAAAETAARAEDIEEIQCVLQAASEVLKNETIDPDETLTSDTIERIRGTMSQQGQLPPSSSRVSNILFCAWDQGHDRLDHSGNFVELSEEVNSVLERLASSR